MLSYYVGILIIIFVDRSRDKVMVTREKSSILEYQESVLAMVEHVIRQWLMPLRGLDRGSNEDKWLNEAIVKFLNIINIDHVSFAAV